MTGFAIDDNGDVIIENGRIRMVSGEELIRQTAETVLGTQKGEWFLNLNEGLDYSRLLGHGVSEDLIRNEIQSGLLQVDRSFVIDRMQIRKDANTRKLFIDFSAHNASGTVIEVEKQWD